MIRINLAPATETEVRFWWIPDLVVLVIAIAAAIGGVMYYHSITEAEIERLTQETQRMREANEGLKADLSQYDETMVKIKDLESMRDSLVKITESKLERYLPLILLEHIQSLKPEGVWLSDLSFKKGVNAAAVEQPPPPPPPPPVAEEGAPAATPPPPAPAPRPITNDGRETIEINGYAFDNMLLAEFMTVLKATRNQESEAADLRTQVFFDAIDLQFSDIRQYPRKINNETKNLDVVGFRLVVTFQNKNPERPEVDLKLSQLLDRYRAVKHGKKL